MVGGKLLLLTILLHNGVAIQYDGSDNSWMQYEKWNLCPHAPAQLSIKVNTSREEKMILVYMDGGDRNSDYLLMQLEDRKVTVEYQYGGNSNPAVISRDDKGVEDGAPTSISIERNRMGFILKINDDEGANQPVPNYGSDLCFGECNLEGLNYLLSAGNSDLYIGGMPPAVKRRAEGRVTRGLGKPFTGEISNVHFKNCNCLETSPSVVAKGTSIDPASDVCYGRTDSEGKCACQRSGDDCSCLKCTERCTDSDGVTHYEMTFHHRDNTYIVNYQGLDDKVIGTVDIETVELRPYIHLSRDTWFQFAGESQRDECLGNLQLCRSGYTLAFWMVILNENLVISDGTLLDNGGYRSHGISVFWRNNALYTWFVMPDGRYWQNVAYEFYPARIYHEEKFNNYWYHYAASWSGSVLQVYLNGEAVGTSSILSKSVDRFDRSNFIFGSRDSSSNEMGISTIDFYSTYKTREEIIGLTGPQHYYITMNRVDGNRVAAWPGRLGAVMNGPYQLIPGVSDMALRLGVLPPGQEIYIDAGDCRTTCFGMVGDCNFYISFWLMLDSTQARMTILDTGSNGISIQIYNSVLTVYVYEVIGGMPIEMSGSGLQSNRWYFIELDRNIYERKEEVNTLWIDGKMVAAETFASDVYDSRLVREGGNSRLLIGKSNGNTFGSRGMFTIDQLDMLHGNLAYLLTIGHIQRGMPPHIFYSMNGMQSKNSDYRDYLDYYRYHIQRDPTAKLIPVPDSSPFVTGKDMQALKLSDTTFRSTQSLRNEECFHNLEKCIHGVLVRGWFQLDKLRRNGGIMSTGLKGIDMAFLNGQLIVTAKTLSRKWEVTVPGAETAKWMFLEFSFHPKYGLVVFKDEMKVGEMLRSEMNVIRNGESDFIIGAPEGRGGVDVTVDELEIWYGDRDYVCSKRNIQCTTGGRAKHYIIDFDEWDPNNGYRLDHENLIIPANGRLIDGLFQNALSVNGSSNQQAEVSYIKPNTLVRDACFGNLQRCPEGYTVSFYIKPTPNSLRPTNPAVYFLSTGVHGIDVFYVNGSLVAEARDGERKWQVKTAPNFLVEGHWNKIIAAWSPVKGLLLARDEKMYLIEQDIAGEPMTTSDDDSRNSRFLIGQQNPGASHRFGLNGLQVAYDEMHIIYRYDPPRPIEHDSISFERNNSIYQSKIEHPKFQIWLRNGAEIKEGYIGNTSSLNGISQYVDLGDHTDSCIDNLDMCKSTGLTLTFRMKINRGSLLQDQVLLSGNSYDVSIADGNRLQVMLMTKDKQWRVASYNIPFDEWVVVDVAWTEDEGLKLFVNNRNVDNEDRSESRQLQWMPGTHMFVGRAQFQNQANRRYFGGEIDELHFFRSTREELVKRGIIPEPRCAFVGFNVSMDEVSRRSIVSSNPPRNVIAFNGPLTVPGLIGNGIELQNHQYIDVGSRLSCQSQPDQCLNGFTMRVAIKPQMLNSNSYLISGNPAEITYENDGKVHVKYRSLLGEWEAALSGMRLNEWYSIDLSWDDENGMTVYVNNVQRAWIQNATSAIPYNYNQDNRFLINRPSSDLVTSYSTSQFVVDDLQLWNAKRELLVACGLLPVTIERHIATYPGNGKGYIRLTYLPLDYKVNVVNDEEFYLRFQAAKKDGLLWYNKNGDIKSYIYLMDGDMWFVTQNGETVGVPIRITNRRYFSDEDNHEVKVTAGSGNQLRFYVDGSRVKTITTDHLVRILTDDFNVGGHVDVSKVTDGKVTSSFVGSIMDVKVSSSSFPQQLDLFGEMWKTNFPGYVRVNCDIKFDPEIDAICDPPGSSVTFTEGDSYIEERSWSNDGGTPSIEILFTPNEPRGVLLFAGSKNSDYFALEMFDRKLYMVADMGSGVMRSQVSPDELEDENVPHTATFVFDVDQRKILVSFDERRRREADRDLPTSLNGRENLFEGPVYIGGYVDLDALPWFIWSRVGFVGCVGYLKINTVHSELQKLYKDQRRSNIVDGCIPFPNFCASNPCENGAPCYNRKDRYECDCTGMIHADFQNDVCAKLTLIGTINGSTYYDIGLGKLYKTHVNDFSTLFKTMAEDGTMWMTHSPDGNSYIKVYFEDGDLKVDVKAKEVITYTITGKYNDFVWHKLVLRRRGNELYLSVDDAAQSKVYLSGEDFFIYMDEIRLGADTPYAGDPPYFFGYMRNFRWPLPTDGTPPFIENPIPIPWHPITFKTTEALIKIPNIAEEMRTAFKIVVMIKTKLKDALFLYQPGAAGQYLAALLKDGRLNIRFNFGARDELIEVPSVLLNNDNWHIIEIDRASSDKLQVQVDYGSPIIHRFPTSSLKFDHIGDMYLGGVPPGVSLPNNLKQLIPDGLNGYKGCMASFLKHKTLIDIGNLRYQDLATRAANLVVRGCQDWESCNPKSCLHGCVCDDVKAECDNSMIPYYEKDCRARSRGYEFYVDNVPGHIRYDFSSPRVTTGNRISFGFKSCRADGLLVKLSGEMENEQIRIYLRGNNIIAKYQLGGAESGEIVLKGDYTNNWYIVNFVRQGVSARLSVLNDTTGKLIEMERASLVASDNQLDGLRSIEIGSERVDGKYENGFSGIITGFKHEDIKVFDIALDSLSSLTYVKTPGTVISTDPDNYRCGPALICGPDKQICKNFGVCQDDYCNCTLTAFRGPTCEDEPVGHYYGFDRFQPGLDIRKYQQPVSTYEDYFVAGIMTYEGNQTVFRVENVDKSQYYHIRLLNGKARLDYKLQDEADFIELPQVSADSRDSVYYVIRMNRTRENITFFIHQNATEIMDSRKVSIPQLANVTFKDQYKIMAGGVVARTSLDAIEDDWNGILGGLYYNGRYMYDFQYDGIFYNKSGDVAQAPHPFKLKFEKPAECPKCYFYGIRTLDKSCDCTYASYGGKCCNETELFGFQMKKNGGNSVVIYNASIPGSDSNDLAVSFRTALGWGDAQIVRIESKDGTQYIIVEIKDDKLQVQYKLGQSRSVRVFEDAVRQQSDHYVRVHREGNDGYIQLDGTKIKLTFAEAGIFNPNVIYVGGAYNGTTAVNGHYGIIWKIMYNGIDVVKQANSDTAAGISVVAEGSNNFDIIPYPWPVLCNKGSTDPECNLIVEPPGPGGGAGILVPGMANPGGPIGVVGLSTPVATPPGALIGAIMGGLLFSSAIAFAAIGMKPGFLALSKRLAGAGGKGAYVPVADGKSPAFPVSNGSNVVALGMEEHGAGGSQAGSRSQYEGSYTHESRFDATDTSLAGGGGGVGAGQGYNAYNTSSSWYTRNETLENQNAAYGGGSTIGYGNGRAGYAGSVTGGSVAGSVYGFGTVTNPDQAFITLSEDIAVDNVVLTADGRYVVTGSNLGPPQVWNTTNGEMVTTMRGDYMGSTGLHLAANEQYLIGETMAEQAAVDMNDIQTGNHIPIRRVAVWDFNTGNPLPIAVDQLCTASCVSKDGFKVVMAMTDKFGGGTTVKVLDLLSNKVLHEMTYPDTIGVADSASCVFISPDDRFVAVGFTNSFDNNANFIIFDLMDKTGVTESPIVALNADPHCTVILNHDEALTGTKNGELVIWSMKTGKAQRQLTSGDAVMLSQGGMPAAHDREVKEVALSDDGKYLASASADRTVKIWSMDTESLLHTLHGHNDEVWTVDIASDNSIVVSGSQDGTIKLWRLRNGNQVTSFNATMDIFHARFSKDKKTVVALGDKFGARKLIMLQIVSQKKWRMRSS